MNSDLISLIDLMPAKEKQDLQKTFNNKHKNIAATSKLFRGKSANLHKTGKIRQAAVIDVCLALNEEHSQISQLVSSIVSKNDKQERLALGHHLRSILSSSPQKLIGLLEKELCGNLNRVGLLPRFQDKIKQHVRPLTGFVTEYQSVISTLPESDIDEVVSQALELGKLEIELGKTLQRIYEEVTAYHPHVYVKGCQIEIIEAKLVPFINPEGKEFQQVILSWKNTGRKSVRVIFGDIIAFDSTGKIVYDVPDYCLFARNNGEAGVLPESSYTTGDNGETGHLLLPNQLSDFTLPNATRVEITVSHVSNSALDQ